MDKEMWEINSLDCWEIYQALCVMIRAGRSPDGITTEKGTEYLKQLRDMFYHLADMGNKEIDDNTCVFQIVKIGERVMEK